MSFIHILMTFYKKNTMLYVGRNWKDTGYKLLLGLSAYCAIFITYSWNNHIKNTYHSFYRPSLELLPPTKYADNQFSFDAEMPVKINHPITDEKAYYIDTSIEEIPEEAYEYRTVITKNTFIIGDIPFIPRSHWFTHKFVLFPPLLSDSPFQSNEFIASKDLIKPGDQVASTSFVKVFILAFIVLGFTEFIKTTFITYLVMFMFKNGSIKTKRHKDFKLVHRLCVLTYIPVILTNTLYFYNLSSPGIFMLITTSFVHIILLMTAIHINVIDDAEASPTTQ